MNDPTELTPAVPPSDELTPASWAWAHVHASILLAVDVAAARVTEPETFPTIPAGDFAAWLTRKTLAELMGLGFTPEGWQDAYFAMSVAGDR